MKLVKYKRNAFYVRLHNHCHCMVDMQADSLVIVYMH